MLIKPYHPSIKFKNFLNLDEQIDLYYDFVFYRTQDEDVKLHAMTERYQNEHGLKIGSRDIFYYIDTLYDNKPSSVIDVGCGECVFKKWFPNIIGFDPAPSIWSAVDFIDIFDESFSEHHTKYYDCGMALNSLHFTEWNNIKKQINLAMNIVKDRFLFTFWLGHFENKPISGLGLISDLIPIFTNILTELPYKIVLLDYPTLRGMTDRHLYRFAHCNGQVRFILAHNS